MPKAKTLYVCQQCEFQQPKWTGQCPNCGAWSSFVETVVEPVTTKAGRKSPVIESGEVVTFDQVQIDPHAQDRVSTGIGEFDRVLGETAVDGSISHGLVKGAVVLLGGEPGIGKSTLITQSIVNMLIGGVDFEKEQKNAPLATTSSTIVYVSGEESPHQIGMRIQRLIKMYSSDSKQKHPNKIQSEDWSQRLVFVTTTDVDKICSIISDKRPQFVVIDSIQTLETTDLMGASGSVGQLRESTQRITNVAKQLHIPTILIGHVTKEGTIAGPKILEHIVDTVLELSGERSSSLRILRAIKNRFGATDEVGLFQMDETGLHEVTNPSELLLQPSGEAVSGSAVVSVMEGTRPLLVEVQALVVKTQLAIPRRVAQGISMPRLQVLCAVLQKHARLNLSEYDVFVNIAGGLQVKEPGVDLGVALAVASSYYNQPLPKETLCIGEVGLLGEIRPVPLLDKRTKEGKRLGFPQVISANSHSRLPQAIAAVLKKKAS